MKNIFLTLLVIFALSCSNNTSINTQVIDTSEVDDGVSNLLLLIDVVMNEQTSDDEDEKHII